MSLDPKIIATLAKSTTATITTILLKKGLRNVWMRGSRPLTSATSCGSSRRPASRVR